MIVMSDCLCVLYTQHRYRISQTFTQNFREEKRIRLHNTVQTIPDVLIFCLFQLNFYYYFIKKNMILINCTKKKV